MKLRVAGVVPESLVDGPGVRFALFVQGCPLHCPGCQNPHTHDPAGGDWADTADLATLVLARPWLDCLTLTGGEPFAQATACLDLVRRVQGAVRSVWVFTGYVFEEIRREGDPDRLALLAAADVLVDGPYLGERRNLDLPFRGSTNQRLIDAPASLAAGAARLWRP